MTSRDPLVKLFAGLLSVGAVGCSERVKDDALDSDPDADFSLDLCAGGDLRPLMAIEPAEPVDSLELREALYDGSSLADVRIVDADGKQCSGATDDEACEVAFDALPYLSEFFVDDFGTRHTTLAFSRGDEVGALTTVEGFRAFLGEIDAPGDAALWAEVLGHAVLCGPGDDVGEHDNGYIVRTASSDDCGVEVEHHVILVRPDGSIEVLSSEVVAEANITCPGGTGRLPGGYCRPVARHRGSAVARALSEITELEAAAVPAFAQLGRELRAHGAPPAFVAAAARAQADEVRHARTMARIARFHGGTPTSPRVRRMPIADMLTMASENAAEGCVRETFGALLAHHQACHATDPALRRAMRVIASEETQHARLSWNVDRWARSRMRPAERAKVARSARQSIERLRESLTAAQDPEVHAVLGLPRPDEARAMFGGLHAGLLRQLEA